jgi:uncharacterized membrane protein
VTPAAAGRDRVLRLALAATATAGLGVAAYLTWVHYHPEALVCTRGGGCETVQRSHYAVLLGVPVAIFGLAAWAAVLGLAVIDTPTARALVAAVAVVAVLFAGYLVVVQLAVIDAICVWCMANDVVLVPLLGLLSVLRLRADE